MAVILQGKILKLGNQTLVTGSVHSLVPGPVHLIIIIAGRNPEFTFTVFRVTPFILPGFSAGLRKNLSSG